MKNIIKKVTDVITIVFPAAIAVAGALEAAGIVAWLTKAEGIVVAVIAAIAAVASVVYNVVTKPDTESTKG